ncbi:MAG: glycosyltransferase [Magnetococcus sp. WYHC-3]
MPAPCAIAAPCRVLYLLAHAGRCAPLVETLRAIAAQENVAARIFLADASRTGLGELPSDLPPVQRVRCPETGIVSARNAILAAAAGEDCDWVFLLDDDIVLRPECTRRLAAMLETRPDAGMAVPLLFAAEGSVLSSGGYYLRIPGQPLLRRDRPLEPRRMDFATGGIGLYRPAALAASGGFDKAFDPYGFEDIDLGLRLGRAGWTLVLDPLAQACHVTPYSFHRPTPFHLRHTTAHRLLCAWRHGHSVGFWCVFLPWFLLRRVLWPLLRRLLGGDGAAARAIVAGVANGAKQCRAHHNQPRRR